MWLCHGRYMLTWRVSTDRQADGRLVSMDRQADRRLVSMDRQTYGRFDSQKLLPQWSAFTSSPVKIKHVSYYVSDSWLQRVRANTGRKLVRISKNQYLSTWSQFVTPEESWGCSEGVGSTAAWHPTWDMAAPKRGLLLPSRAASWNPTMFLGFSFHSGE